MYSTCFDFQPLYFMFDNYWIMLDAADYLQDISPTKDRSACLLLIQPIDQDFFIMGLPLFKGYYSIHDMTKKSISFIPVAEGKKPFLNKYKLPTKTLDKRENINDI